MRTIHTLIALATLAGAAGCTTSMPPPELVTARSIYDRAAHGPTAQVNPTDLHTAKESLDAAEQSFERDGDTQDTRDLGYTAGRRSETAETRARVMMAMTQKEQVLAQMHASTASQAQLSAADLARANQMLASSPSRGASSSRRGARPSSRRRRSS